MSQNFRLCFRNSAEPFGRHDVSLFGFTLARIDGPSMEPSLPDKSLALFRAKKSVGQGDVVLIDHPHFGMIVKCARSVESDGAVWLEGTSPASTSAEKLGRVSPDCIKGVLVARLS
ncbi:MAG: S24 family peptidase [Pseudomonadota bacterium]